MVTEQMFDLEATAIISQLDRMPPGPDLAEALEKLDGKRLSLHDRLVVIQARQRLIRYLEAHLIGMRAAIKRADESYQRTDGQWTRS